MLHTIAEIILTIALVVGVVAFFLIVLTPIRDGSISEKTMRVLAIIAAALAALVTAAIALTAALTIIQ